MYMVSVEASLVALQLLHQLHVPFECVGCISTPKLNVMELVDIELVASGVLPLEVCVTN